MHSRIVEHLKSYRRVVITGGSSGIGMAFIKSLDNIGLSCEICNLSRTEPDLFLSSIRLQHFPCDVSDTNQVSATYEALTQLSDFEEGRILLINNSGYGSYGEFADSDLTVALNMMDLNMRGLVQLTGLFLPRLLRNGGSIMNIASTAAWQPTPYMAVYGATKAFVLQWSLALNAELQGKGVGVLAVCPGPTESQFFRRAGFGESPLTGWGQTAEQVVETSFSALAAGRALVVCGWMNKLLVALSCRLPRNWQGPISAMVLRKMRLEAYQAAKKGSL